MSHLTNPILKHKFNFLVPWNNSQRSEVIIQFLAAADVVARHHLASANKKSLADFALLIQDDRACDLLDYPILTRWISVLPYLCACQRALRAGNIDISDVKAQQIAIHDWLVQPLTGRNFTNGELYVYEVLFAIAKALIHETVSGGMSADPAACSWAQPDTRESIERLDFSASQVFQDYIKQWKLGWPSKLKQIFHLNREDISKGVGANEDFRMVILRAVGALPK